MSIWFINKAGLNSAVEKEIVQLLRELGPVPMYRLVKELRVTYGAAQYHVERLVKLGMAYTVKVGARRYVALSGQNWLDAVTVGDVLEELNAALKRAKITPKTPLNEALKTLKQSAPHVAEALTFVVAALGDQTHR
jgi:DNA-binding Lrp family transcriptional regulator